MARQRISARYGGTGSCRAIVAWSLASACLYIILRHNLPYDMYRGARWRTSPYWALSLRGSVLNITARQRFLNNDGAVYGYRRSINNLSALAFSQVLWPVLLYGTRGNAHYASPLYRLRRALPYPRFSQLPGTRSLYLLP